MRVDPILNKFKNCKYIFSISSPYLYIGSALSKVKKSNRRRIKKITKNWINKANMQIKNINQFGESCIQTTYENFCDSQNDLLKSLNLDPNLILGNNITIEGKENTKITKIINMLHKHLTFLGMSGILQINDILKDHIDILNFFGYKILTIDLVIITLGFMILITIPRIVSLFFVYALSTIGIFLKIIVGIKHQMVVN